MRIISACYFHTFIGNYHRAVEMYDIPVSFGVDTLDLDQYKIKPALEKIVAEAQDKQIVTISESHLKPQHRIFAKEIIVALAAHGFSHLGLETFGRDISLADQLSDTILNQRGYADLASTGWYTREPQMADVVRTASKNGYRFFGYEREKKIPNVDRDEIQADNVINYLKKNPGEKIILLCGWYRAVETKLPERGNSTYLAGYLKAKIGIDPLTIYQDNFTEKVLQNEHELLSKIQIEEPSVFVNDQDEIARLTDKVDIEVIHPKTKYVNGRPRWLYQDPSYKEYNLDRKLLDIEFPLFLKAYVLGEQDDGVPVDIIEMKDRYDQRKLILRPGAYMLRLENRKQVKDLEIEVE